MNYDFLAVVVDRSTQMMLNDYTLPCKFSLFITEFSRVDITIFAFFSVLFKTPTDN